MCYGPDLAALGHGAEHGWFNSFLEDSLNAISRRLTAIIFRSPEQRIQIGSEQLQLISPSRLDIFLRIVLTFLASILLLVPVLVLFKSQPSVPAEAQRANNYQILTIFLFTFVFSISCSIFTKARRMEVFMTTAAYCAVLVVFIENSPGMAPNTRGGLDQNSG